MNWLIIRSEVSYVLLNIIGEDTRRHPRIISLKHLKIVHTCYSFISMTICILRKSNGISCQR